ncbi:mechanosensitive ion channel [Paenarthrobacter sp. OM7]|uniref:Mechanosensitive ion channel family protein n=1 Tax=Paenarthrobacter sp. AMU7 TaxID=3162492 RepID=A0AB39YM20_9MICC|nr:mechanosensitive ion channel domain-containing protein [Paenarthrobacter sp. OM7]WGM20438.1 mechanosensitive ion channel [Paenarthrobacter sp. OM7]
MPLTTSDLNKLLTSSALSGWDILLALASVVAGLVASVYARRAVHHLLGQLQGLSPTAKALGSRAVQYSVLLVGIGVAATFLGASVQPVIAVTLTVVTVLVLALRGISANFAAGVVLQTRRPLSVGDEIEVGDYIGRVLELNGRSVVILTRDGRTIHVPNVLLLEGPLVNHSEHGYRRTGIQVRCTAGVEEFDRLRILIEEETAAVPGVSEKPKPSVLLVTSAPGVLTLTLRFWHAPLAAPILTSQVVHAVGAGLNNAQVDAVVTSNIPDPPLTPPLQF